MSGLEAAQALRREVIDRVEAIAVERDLEYARPDADSLVVQLPGERRLKTPAQFTAGPHGVRVEAFVCRHPDENTDGVHTYLLRRNRRLYGVAYTVDSMGDIYLVGRLATELVTEDEIDRILGQILEAADGDFNVLLELGFAESIRREWKWRVSRGESLANLTAFEHLITDEDRASVDGGR